MGAAKATACHWSEIKHLLECVGLQWRHGGVLEGFHFAHLDPEP
jgi:hypothetical protein